MVEISTTSAPIPSDAEQAASQDQAAAATEAAASTAAATPASGAAAPAPAAATFIGGRQRATTVSLEWPLSFNGRIYASITLKRLTAGEVAAFLEDLSKQPTGATFKIPIYVDAAGAPVPSEVLEALDDDDQLAIEKAAAGFLPRRFRDTPASDTAPGVGDITGRVS